MATTFSRRSLMAAATAVGSTIIVKPTRAADYTFAQYHNQPAGGTLHKTLGYRHHAFKAGAGTDHSNGRPSALNLSLIHI